MECLLQVREISVRVVVAKPKAQTYCSVCLDKALQRIWRQAANKNRIKNVTADRNCFGWTAPLRMRVVSRSTLRTPTVLHRRLDTHIDQVVFLFLTCLLHVRGGGAARLRRGGKQANFSDTL